MVIYAPISTIKQLLMLSQPIGGISNTLLRRSIFSTLYAGAAVT